MNFRNPSAALLAVNLLASVGLGATDPTPIHAFDGNFEPGRVLAFNQRILDVGVPITAQEQFGRALATNASQAFVNSPSEFLSQYAVRYSDPHQDELRALREAIAPEVMSNNSAFVQYPIYGFTDAFLAMDNAVDTRRAVGADFATIQNTSKTLATVRMPEIGLAIEVDEEEELLDADWQQRKVAFLLGILDRTELRTAIALLAAGATNVNKTWNTVAGVDPDMDVLVEIDALPIKPNNVWYGPGANVKRLMALRAQNLAGQANSATLTLDQRGALLNANVQVPQPRYATGASTTGAIFGNVVMLFSSFPGMNRDDFSNLKTFMAPARNGQKRAVWVRQIGDRRWRIVVSTGKRLVALTSAIGLETITVS